MSKLTAEDLAGTSTTQRSRTYQNSVDFFKLGDGEQTYARIIINSIDDLANHALTLHNTTVNGKRRDINCIRTAHEPIEQCPLCEAGLPVQRKYFIPVIKYSSNADGSLTPVPALWCTTSKKVVTRIIDLIQRNGDLTNVVCLISRTGISLDTRWEISPLPGAVSEEQYPLDTKPFEKYNFLGTLVLDKTFEELSQFLLSNSFPAPQKTTTTNNVMQTESIPQTVDINNTTFEQQISNRAMVQNVVQPQATQQATTPQFPDYTQSQTQAAPQQFQQQSVIRPTVTFN